MSGEWFGEGLRFKCVGCECGACCSGASGPGAVWVNEEEIAALARAKGLEVGEFSRRFLRLIDGKPSLVEKANFDCVFYAEGMGCGVYEARPAQCRAYPFWGRIVASRGAWDEEARKCPGIVPEAPIVPAEEIARCARAGSPGASVREPGP